MCDSVRLLFFFFFFLPSSKVRKYRWLRHRLKTENAKLHSYYHAHSPHLSFLWRSLPNSRSRGKKKKKKNSRRTLSHI